MNSRAAAATADIAKADQTSACRPTALQTPDVDTQADPRSLIGARIAAARVLVGPKAKAMGQDNLLFAANAVHRKAQRSPRDYDARSASIALWREEAAAWARANDAGPGIGEATRLRAYQEQWSLALDPPPVPAFQDRSALATAYVLERSAAGLPYAIAQRPSPTPVPVKDLIEHYKDDPEVRTRYYGQFARYIESHLDRFSTLSAIADADRAGVHALRLYEAPTRLWHVEEVTQFPSGAHRLPSGAILSASGRSLGPSFIAELPGGQFVHVDARGTVKRLAGAVVRADGELHASAVLRAYGLAAQDPGGTGGPGAEYVVRAARRDAMPLRELVIGQRKQALGTAITQWKKDNYQASWGESIMGTIIPFYDVYHQLKWDPGYRVQFEDIAWDSVGLALTVASVAMIGLGGPAGVAAAAGAIRAAVGQGVREMVKAGLRSVVRHFSLKALLLQGAREAADFVVPVFSARELLRGIGHLAPLGKRAMLTALKETAATMQGADPRLLLDGIYEHLARTGAAGKTATPESIRRTLQAAAARPVPSRVYRGHSGNAGRKMLQAGVSIRPGTTGDDILVACIVHSASTGGSCGKVLSLSADRSVAVRFGKERPEPHLFAIDTTSAPGDFRTVEDILLNEGPRLVQQGKIQPGTLRAAIQNTLLHEESEIFYMGGSIPDRLIKTVSALPA
ncbi:hypothetical protein [Bordetella flabilis]|uniref:Uncharacterized protein n=2 Tax=Bordetella flabilis TaxID=463014 RepID=A0A193G7P4_9BORD|nr:hypothetical protein [Bordetella flabilis]ANN76002.1 hypothetical protein BAU07_01680 [Bordetella flabilis]